MSDWRPGISRDALVARAQLLAAIRAFFRERDVLEVDTPLLASYAVTDPALEPMTVAASAEDSPRFLQTSPEFAMKRLLAAGSGPIYQLGRAFRAAEAGSRHNPEFTMLEWYRPGFSLSDLMHEVGELAGRCLGREGFAINSYRELFLAQIGIDPWLATPTELEAAARERLELGRMHLDSDGWLDLLMSHCIEPALAGGLVFVTDYPASQAALARCVERDGICVAERFELYVDGMELANGYRELLDPRELVSRAARDNARRRAVGQEERVLDPRLLAAMEAGLPDCSGVALGVDRLLMIALGVGSLDQVLPFSWSRS